MANDMPAVFSWTVRVYYEDTDAGGIVYYANYLKFFERARTEWLRSRDLHQQRLIVTHGAMFVVKRASIDYHAPAKLDDEITLTLSIEKLGKVSVEFLQQAWRGPVLLATGHVKVGCVDCTSVRPLPIPAAVAERMRALTASP
jgi:acyl-CoA thioester hydrolase